MGRYQARRRSGTVSEPAAPTSPLSNVQWLSFTEYDTDIAFDLTAESPVTVEIDDSPGFEECVIDETVVWPAGHSQPHYEVAFTPLTDHWLRVSVAGFDPVTIGPMQPA